MTIGTILGALGWGVETQDVWGPDRAAGRAAVTRGRATQPLKLRMLSNTMHALMRQYCMVEVHEMT
jgi:hypothetical protein